jgi:proteic killer suppression protein
MVMMRLKDWQDYQGQCVSCRGKLTQQTPNARGGGEIALDNDNGYRYYQTMITSFRCRETEKIFKGKFSATLPQAIQKAAARKLEIIDAARDLDDLRTPPGNRLEALSCDRREQHSIRINEQWRVCFVWITGFLWLIKRRSDLTCSCTRLLWEF